MFSIIIGFFTALINPISSIVSKIQDAKIEAIKASTDQEKIAADERVKTLEMRRDVLVAESGTPINSIIRAGIAIGPMVYLLKIFIWDKVIGAFAGLSCYKGECSIFNTDPLDSNLWKVIVAVCGFYLLSEMAARLKR